MGVRVRKDVPNSMVYEMAKAIHENLAELTVIHPAFKRWTPEMLANGPFVPYHPGALKYYQDAGLITPESLAKHKELLLQSHQNE
jgi:hypothetical protein